LSDFYEFGLRRMRGESVGTRKAQRQNMRACRHSSCGFKLNNKSKSNGRSSVCCHTTSNM